MVTADDYGKFETAWCPGCGNFLILESLKNALAGLELEPHQVLVVSGIGQASKAPQYMRCNMFNGLHGRILPVATAAKLANHELTVIGEGGDGDGYAEGGNHFIHAIRRNIDVTYIVHDNQVYGLTKGQTSPTSDVGFRTGTSPEGSYCEPFHPLTMAVAHGCGFVARGFAGEKQHLSNIIQQGIKHNGFALIDVLQPCVSFNRVNTFKWYKDRIYMLDETDYDNSDQTAAFFRSREWGEKIPIGVIYRHECPPMESHEPAVKRKPLVQRKWEPVKLAGILESLK